MNLLVRLAVLRAELNAIADRIEAERKFVREILLPRKEEWEKYLESLPEWLEELEEEIRGLWDEMWGENQEKKAQPGT